MPKLSWLAQQISAYRGASNRDKAKYVAIAFAKVLNAACALHLFAEYIGRISHTEGPSMLPTMADYGEWVIEDRISFRLFPQRLQRGDLVVLQSPIHSGRFICKRIIGMPGDIVCVDPTGEYAPPSEHVIIPKGHIWVSGDNAAHSRDSRLYGPVSMSLIQGRLRGRVWPLREATIFRNPTTLLSNKP